MLDNNTRFDELCEGCMLSFAMLDAHGWERFSDVYAASLYIKDLK